MAISASQKRIHRAALRLFAEKGSTAVTVSELAEASGVARGTIYNNGLSPESLFEDIATQLSAEMNARVIKTLGAEKDAAKRIAMGLRMYMRRAHEEPDWGRFLCKFAFSSQSLMSLWTGQSSPLSDMQSGIVSNRLRVDESQLVAVMSMVAGTVLSSMFLILEGFKTWRDIGTETAVLVLRALGIEHAEAERIAAVELPPLQEL